MNDKIDFYTMTYVAFSNDPIGITSCIEGATEIFNAYNVPVLCIDVPRAQYCTDLKEAQEFFRD